MNLVDLLLNLVGLLLWLGWRGTGSPVYVPRSAFGTLITPPAAAATSRWGFLAALIAVLGGRAWLYWRLGSEVGWVPSVDLGVITFPFNSVSLGRMLLFSVTGFGAIWAVFYLWLILLSVVNRGFPEPDVLQRFVRRQLGGFNRWPSAAKLGFPAVLAAVVWAVAEPGLVDLGMVAPSRSSLQVLEQAVVFGVGIFAAWKYLIVGMLFLHVLNSYLYLGNSFVWKSINGTAAGFLKPLRWLPLRLGRIDFAPLVGMALTMLGIELAERGLTRLFARLPL